ncbi:uncharacterized protein si:dkey-171c9.3 [Chelmon rostratus]|uniref:uncharacterized protein si:dkey-171c9.3 n=1 Tax=Chelmon rostratus TaxID=109905 RepID=UPI001BED296C|nr:uncharacterized protein si:dkey-171c9.3 [Chelmon rostratus]
MQAVSADPRMPEPSPENFGISEGLKRSHLNNGALEKFAQNMADNIIQSFLSQMEIVGPEVDFRMSRFNQNQEMLAEGLASAVIEVALREVCGGRKVEDHLEGFQGSRSAGLKVAGEQGQDPPLMDQSESEGGVLDMDTKTDPGKEIQTSKDAQHCHHPLSQSGLPLLGSLDYPDAPPTTPLLPELERSRHSFARKLKGGLAKVFLPSPPPPTPQDKEDNSDSAAHDPRVELMEHLMQSLPQDDLARDYFEAGAHRGAKMEAFAEALSSEIIGRALSAKNQDDSDLHLLAHQLAETIITSSLDEARMIV